MNFTFDIVSPKYGTFTVTAPERFRSEIATRTWCVGKHPTRALRGQFVVMTSPSRGVSLYLHRFIWELAGNPPTETIDHADGSPLNNGEDNLRAATRVENVQNRPVRRDNSSGIPGVHYSANVGKWCARVQANGKRVFVGYFDTAPEATSARNAKAAELHGRFAFLSG